MVALCSHILYVYEELRWNTLAVLISNPDDVMNGQNI